MGRKEEKKMSTLRFNEPVASFGQPIIIRDSHTTETESTGGFLLGLVILVALLGLFFYYLLPYVQTAFTAPSVNVPASIDVNINQK